VTILLRRSRVGDFIGLPVDPQHIRHGRNRLHHSQTCDGCPWGDRCRTDQVCWRREKADIAAAAKPGLA
jgi:hypothetical protein